MPFPITAIKFYPETGLYGYDVWFEGRSPHHGPNTCRTKQDAIDTCDPQRQHIWEEVNDPNTGILMISRAYVPGSVLDRMQRLDESAPRLVKSPWSNTSAAVARINRKRSRNRI